jgi:ABC-type siderophore export system fused ATPase/permease subunit
MKSKLEFILEWTSTIILLCGAALTSLNIYPANVFLSLVGNAGWLAVSLMWRKKSLIVIQLVITVIYVAGLIDKGVI